MDFQSFKDLCQKRRSIRFFDEKPVTKEQIRSLLEVATLAPNIENLQPWHFHVITNTTLRSKLMEASCYGNFIEGSGVFIVVTVNRSKEYESKKTVWNPKELEYSCMTAVENLLLGAAAMGLGGTWVSLHHGIVHEVLELPLHEVIIGGMLIGHIHNKGAEEGIEEHKRKPVDDVSTFHE